MKKLLPFFLAGFLGGVALAQGVLVKTFNAAYAVPTTVNDGIDLSGAESWDVVLSADAGETFTGGGSALCYYYGSVAASGFQGDVVTRRWMRCKTTFDVAPTASVRDYVSPGFTTAVGMGRIAYVPYALGVNLPDAGVQDGGVNITIEVRRRP